MVIDPSNPSLNKTSGSASGGPRLKPAAGAESAAGGKAPSQAAADNLSAKDNVSLSPEAQTLGRVEQAMKKSPDVNEAKVAAIRQALAEGRYQVNSDRIAERMLAQDDSF